MRPVLTIDLDAAARNWRRLAALAAPAECAAVVKADAYGLGAAQLAPAFAAAGARSFFVATAEEGVALRDLLGPGRQIWVFNGATAQDAADLAAADVRPLLNSPGQIAAFRAVAKAAPAPCGLQLDTGMNRLGLEAAELGALMDEPRALDGLAVGLTISHLACADEPAHPQNAAQRAAFEAMTARGVGRRSLAATGGTLLGPAWRYDLVRPGVGLYGGLPFREADPVVALEAPVIQLRDVAAGESVGYGAAWRAEGPRRVATVAAGYADGLIRAMGNRARVFWRGAALPLAGRVSMDLLTVDATAAPDLHEGAMVRLLGPEQGVDALAAAAGTIGYEVLTALGSRYARRYVGATAP